MNIHNLKGSLALIVCLVWSFSAGLLPAASPRLFPDITLRYPVGDPQAANPIAATEGPKTLAAADMNGDGLADVIAGNLDGSISVLLGRTNGTLQDQILVLASGVLSNSTLRALVVADFNRDGEQDVAAADIALGSVIVLLGNGDGTFAPWRYLLTPGVQACFYEVEAADVDSDGDVDGLALDFNYCTSPSGTVSRTRRVQIFANDGTGGFATNAPDRVMETAGEGPRSFRIAYLDERVVGGTPPPGATLDLIVANRDSSTLDVFLNTGGLSFSAQVSFAGGDSPRDVAVGDLDSDGYAELVLVNRAANTISIMRGLGGGLFSAPTLEYPAGVLPRQIVLGDLSGDDRLDAAIGGVSGELVVFRGLGDGTFEAGVAVGTRRDGRPLGLALGDFDRDGRLDIATSRGKVFLNDGHFFDGILDLMVALTFRRPDPVGVLYGLGDATFTQPDLYEGPDVGAVAIVGQDMDGDGRKDLVVGNRCAATVIVMHGLGNRRFEYREIIKAYSVEDVAVADMNRDSKPDIIGAGGGLWVLLNGAQTQLVRPTAAQMTGVPEHAGLFINELMALNQKFHVTNSTTPDWIEIYNHSAVTQRLAGWALERTTLDAESERWDFPTTNPVVIPPWRHLVVYCKTKPGNVPGLYATFELSSDGGNIRLLNPSGTEIDFVRFPAMPTDVSYARYSDGARFFAYNPAPTLGTVNRRPANLNPTAERKDPYVGPGGSALGLTARFFDDVAIAYAAVCYRLEGRYTFNEILLHDDSLHGDKQAGDGYFGALLPPLPPGATIEYYLRVVDLEGQVGSSPENPNDAAQLHRITVPQPNPPIRLSELVADNATGLRDERGQFEDWLELVNAGTLPMNLDGLALTLDYFDHRSAWHFPSNSWLWPGERAIVFCDNDPKQGPLHATFKLLRRGDRVFLIQASEWTILDSLSFGPLPQDTSFGLLGNGTDAQWLAWPTLGVENIPIPPRRDPTNLVPEMFSRLQRGRPSGFPQLFLRWTGYTNVVHRVEWTDNLKTWQRAVSSPSHLGEGLFEWSELTGYAADSSAWCWGLDSAAGGPSSDILDLT
jgi:hypothetical protein